MSDTHVREMKASPDPTPKADRAEETARELYAQLLVAAEEAERFALGAAAAPDAERDEITRQAARIAELEAEIARLCASRMMRLAGIFSRLRGGRR